MATPRPIETVLFDAGGVLLDLDYAYLQRLIDAHRIPVEIDALARAEAQARTEIHRRVGAGGRVGDAWRDYFHYILGTVGVPAPAQDGLIDALWEAHHRFGLWTVAIPGSPDAVRELKLLGYRLGVVSNAEGRVERDLDGAGYQGLFETVIDSHVVGVEKPDPKIFAIALERLGAVAETTLFVGDVPSVDVAGARAAGCYPILMDRHDLYDEIDVPRIRNLTELGRLLSELRAGD